MKGCGLSMLSLATHTHMHTHSHILSLSQSSDFRPAVRRHDIRFRLERFKLLIGRLRSYLVLQRQRASPISIIRGRVSTRGRRGYNAQAILFDRQCSLFEDGGETFESPSAYDSRWRPFAEGDTWGLKNGWTYFRGKLTVPRHWEGQSLRLVASFKENYLDRPHDDSFPAGPEGQVWLNCMPPD